MLLAHPASGAASAWLTRHAALLPAGGSVLDVACGSGRHVRWLVARGHRVTGVDRDAAALSALAEQCPAAELLLADVEGAAWPLPGRHFDAVLVTNYLHRPLFPALLGALNDGGMLIVETFAQGQQTIGRPARADFLLQPGELLQRCAGLRVVAFEDGFEPDHNGSAARFVQRIVAVNEGTSGLKADTDPPRYGLSGHAR
jgi:SAM-dependent methyltransferase